MKKKTIISNLQTVFNGDPWYGYSILKTLQKIPEKNINNSFKNGNSVAQILEHMIVWRTFSIEKLKGNVDFKIEINSTEDWNKGYLYSIKEWRQLIQCLKLDQGTLIDLVESKTEAFLETSLPERNYTYFMMLDNSIQHDLYHLGQIALLNK